MTEDDFLRCLDGKPLAEAQSPRKIILVTLADGGDQLGVCIVAGEHDDGLVIVKFRSWPSLTTGVGGLSTGSARRRCAFRGSDVVEFCKLPISSG